MRIELKIFLKILIILIIAFIFMNILVQIFGFPHFLFKPSTFEYLKYMTILTIMPISILTSYLGYKLAKDKNRDGSKWAVLCFIFNIWGLIYLYFISVLSKSNRK